MSNLDSMEATDEALVNALKDLRVHGAPMEHFVEDDILVVEKGEWTSPDGKFKLTKHKEGSYNAEFGED